MDIDEERECIRRDLRTHPRMKADVKKRWVAALRSGKYKQGKGYLRMDADGGVCHCCLGVLADEEDGGDNWVRRGSGVYTLGGIHAAKFLTTEMMEEFGLGNASANILATYNDNSLLSLKDIADAIEECL